MNADSTHPDIEPLQDEPNVTVEPADLPHLAYTATVTGDAKTSGPALDPVETWADHTDAFSVKQVIDGAGKAHVYTIERVSEVDRPECDECGAPIEDGAAFVNVDGGTVHRTEPQHDAGGGLFHAGCAGEYIDRVYR